MDKKFNLQEKDNWQDIPVVIDGKALYEEQVYLLQCAVRDFTKKVYKEQNIELFIELAVLQKLLGIADIEMEMEMPGNIHSVKVEGKIDLGEGND